MHKPPITSDYTHTAVTLDMKTSLKHYILNLQTNDFGKSNNNIIYHYISGAPFPSPEATLPLVSTRSNDMPVLIGFINTTD